MSKYVITGLPRSGTAWTSVFMSYGPSYCVHDFSLKYKSFADTKEDVPYFGVSDPMMSLLVDGYEAVHGKTKLVIIERDFDESMRSSIETFGDGVQALVLKMKEKLDELGRTRDCLVVPFADLFDGGASEIWNYCVDDVDMPEYRMRDLKYLDITESMGEAYNNYERYDWIMPELAGRVGI